MGRSADFGRQTRARVAVEAARIMAEEGVDDFHTAKRKAADRLLIGSRQAMPTNLEVEQELRTYQALFQRDKHQASLRRLRELAVKGMSLLARFSPRLVGPVLEGTAGAFSKVELHVFADQPEDLQLFFMERKIPFETHTRSYRISQSERRDFATYQIVAENVEFEIAVFPTQGMRHAPLSPVTGKPMQRASQQEVQLII